MKDARYKEGEELFWFSIYDWDLVISKGTVKRAHYFSNAGDIVPFADGSYIISARRGWFYQIDRDWVFQTQLFRKLSYVEKKISKILQERFDKETGWLLREVARHSASAAKEERPQ